MCVFDVVCMLLFVLFCVIFRCVVFRVVCIVGLISSCVGVPSVFAVVIVGGCVVVSCPCRVARFVFVV